MEAFAYIWLNVGLGLFVVLFVFAPLILPQTDVKNFARGIIAVIFWPIALPLIIIYVADLPGLFKRG